MGKSEVLTRAHGVMDVVTYESAKKLLLISVFLQHEVGLGERLSCSAFPPASVRLLCSYSPNKGRIISSDCRGVPSWGFGRELGDIWQTLREWGLNRLGLPGCTSTAPPQCTQQPWKAQAGISNLTCCNHQVSLGATFFFFFSLFK